MRSCLHLVLGKSAKDSAKMRLTTRDWQSKKKKDVLQIRKFPREMCSEKSPKSSRGLNLTRD